MKQKIFKYDKITKQAAKMPAKLMQRLGQESPALNTFIHQAFHIQRRGLDPERRYATSRAQAESVGKLTSRINAEFTRVDKAKDYYVKQPGATQSGLLQIHNHSDNRVFKLLKSRIMRQRNYALKKMKDVIKDVKNIQSIDQFFNAEKDILFSYFDAERLKAMRGKYGYDNTDIYLELANQFNNEDPYIDAPPTTLAGEFEMSDIAFEKTRSAMSHEEFNDFNYHQTSTNTWKKHFTVKQLKAYEHNIKKYGKVDE